jgi:hypothetical protein
MSLEMKPQASPVGAGNGYQHFRDVAQAETGGGFTARWETGAARLTLTFHAAPGTSVYTGYGPGRNPDERVPAIIVRRRAKATTFEVTHRIEKR